jgi:D-lyxose ketol-isomerase
MVENKDFYNSDGSFNEEKAKVAYFELMATFNYPIVDRLNGEEFWVADFNLKNFVEVGMAGIFWIINPEQKYTGVEMFLLPGQSIPEHWHVATKDASPKFESCHVRYGSITLFTEGEEAPGVEKRIPIYQRKIAKARKEKILTAGEIGFAEKEGEKHWFKAGPEGAIMTEYATVHDGAGVRFTDPSIVF